MFLRRESTQAIINLADGALLGVGGEARIYSLPQEPALAAKIYHQPDEARARKLAAMLAHPPHDPAHDPAQNHTSIIWPIELLRSLDARHEVVGFLMPRVHAMRCVIDFYHPGTRRKQTPLFNYGYLHRTARNLAAAVGVLHTGGYVIGDVNESNVLVSDTALVTLVDTDSFQVRDPLTSVVYRSPVGKAEFTPPELQGLTFAQIDRLPEHDLFGLAVLIFQLLMEGTHPFAGVFTGAGEPPPVEARILAGHFPYGAGRNAPYRPMPTAPPLGLLAPPLRELFVRCFVAGFRHPQARPTAQQWQVALKEAEEMLRPCAANAQHLFGLHLSACPWCRRAQQLGGRDPFPSSAAVKRGRHLLSLPRKAPRVIHPTYATRRAIAAQSVYSLPQSIVPAYTPTLGLLTAPPAPPPPGMFAKFGVAARSIMTSVMVFVLLFSFCTPGFQSLMGPTATVPRAASIAFIRPDKILIGHTGWIKALAVSSDGQTIATGGADKTVKLWDAATGQLKLTLAGHRAELSALAFSPDGRTLASGAWDGALNWWDARSGELKRAVHKQSEAISALAFAPDGQSLASCSRDQTIVQWDVQSGQSLRRIEVAALLLSTVAFLGGNAMLVADEYGAVIVFDLTTGETKQSFVRHEQVEPPTDRIRAVAVSRDGKLAAFALLGYSVEVWDLATKKLVQRLRTVGVPDTVVFAPDGRSVLSGNFDGTFNLWDVNTGAALRVWRAHTSGVTHLAFAPDGQGIVSTADGTPYYANVFVW